MRRATLTTMLVAGAVALLVEGCATRQMPSLISLELLCGDDAAEREASVQVSTVDEIGAVLPGVPVALSQGDVVTEVVTDSRGVAVIPVAADSEYVLLAFLPGFAEATGGIAVPPGCIANARIALQPAKVGETFTLDCYSSWPEAMLGR